MFVKDYEVFRSWWKRNRSPNKGFSKSYRAVSPLGDIFQVDYNFHENLVKLSLSLASEKSKSYITTIKNGTIIREKDSLNGTSKSLKKKFVPFKNIFSSIPDKDILSLLIGIYEISDIQPDLDHSEKIAAIPSFDKDSVEKKTLSFREKLSKQYASLKLRVLDDFYDSILGISICLAIYLHYFDFVLLGFALGFMGLFFGSIDWIIRNRNPLFLKVISFLFTGGYYFYTGYTRF